MKVNGQTNVQLYDIIHRSVTDALLNGFQPKWFRFERQKVDSGENIDEEVDQLLLLVQRERILVQVLKENKVLIVAGKPNKPVSIKNRHFAIKLSKQQKHLSTTWKRSFLEASIMNKRQTLL
jgi:hypothetical protein